MSEEAVDRAHWSRVAAQWIAWARLPNHDAFWAYRRSLAAFVGPGDGDALEAGCGEGRVSRELKALGYKVFALDSAHKMVRAAAELSSARLYAVADSAALPFDDRRFDLVVAYNILMDVRDVTSTVKEMARVMRSDGRLVVSIVHPFADRGSFIGPDPAAPFLLKEGYFGGGDLRASRSAMDCGWNLPAGHSPWRTTRSPSNRRA